jgi:thiol-disulfide isomerase/thioredoxin
VRPALAFLLAATLLITGCGSQPKSIAASAAQQQAALAGSPGPLATVHAQANELLPGGPSAFHARLASLRGYPVVVNKWASWCGPCASEFPMFQQAALAYGRRVAFLGVNGYGDTTSQAAGFLRRFPVSYPSYSDPNQAIARTIQAMGYDPLTVFLDRSGRIRFVHAGAYATTAALERDIRLYALRG